MVCEAVLGRASESLTTHLKAGGASDLTSFIGR